MNESNAIVKKKVDHVLSQLSSYLIEQRGIIEKEINELSIEKIKEIAIEAKYSNICAGIERQQDNIIRFRPHN